MPDHEVVVVGAGFSGLGAAIALQRAGIDDFAILEQADDVGGTWRDHTYPGIAVDIPSFSYQYSYECNPDWSRIFAPGRELKAYIDGCVDKYGLRSHLRLRTRVESMTFDADAHVWHIATDNEDVTARFVITRAGGLAQPKEPDIEGLESFGGTTMHTANWDHRYDLTGKRVAVIGTGATAVQLVPAIARRVEQLYVFQRTPIWVLPKPDFTVPSPVRRVFDALPFTQQALRLGTAAVVEVLMTLGVVHNRQFPGVVRAAEFIGRRHLEAQVRDPELRRKLTPGYGFGCKRPTMSNSYLRAFTRPGTELVTDPIGRITPTGIETADGVVREIDTLILATGYKVFEPGNVPPIPIVGRENVELGEWWDSERYQAYEGITVPRFPNIFFVPGPYSGTGSSWFFMVETGAHHALRCITEARRRGATLVEVKPEPHERWFADVLQRQENTVFFNNNCASANSYYFDRHGDSPFLRPSTALEAWWRSRHFDLDHYRFAAAA